MHWQIVKEKGKYEENSKGELTARKFFVVDTGLENELHMVSKFQNSRSKLLKRISKKFSSRHKKHVCAAIWSAI